jgi:hypothetical protein
MFKSFFVLLIIAILSYGKVVTDTVSVSGPIIGATINTGLGNFEVGQSNRQTDSVVHAVEVVSRHYTTGNASVGGYDLLPWSNFFKTLQIGLGYAIMAGTDIGYIITNAYYDGTNYRTRTNGSSSIMSTDANHVGWYFSDTVGTGQVLTHYERMHLTPTGLGVGVSNPLYPLHVTGEAHADSISATKITATGRIDAPIIAGTDLYGDLHSGDADIDSLNVFSNLSVIGKVKAIDTISAPMGAFDSISVGKIGTGWVNYSSTSTKVGWSSITNNLVLYRVAGKQVTVWFELGGTSNSTQCYFTVPTTCGQLSITSPITVLNNSASNNAAPGIAYIEQNTSTIQCFIDWSAASWSATGNKVATGIITYYTD